MRKNAILGSVQGYSEETDDVKVQLLETLKTRAKDDCGKVYWAYTDKNSDCYKKQHSGYASLSFIGQKYQKKRASICIVKQGMN